MQSRLVTSLKWAGAVLVPVLLLCLVSLAASTAVAYVHGLPGAVVTAGMSLATLPVFTKQEDIPEAFRPLYKEVDGKWSAPTVGDTAGLSAKNKELLDKLSKSNERAKLLGDRTAEEIQADFDLAKEHREKSAKDVKDIELIKSQMAKEHDKALGKETARSKKLADKLYDVMARREAEAAITSAGGNPKVLLPHILPFIKPVETDEEITVKVVDAKGNVRISDQAGTEMTIAQLVETFKADETFGVAFGASGASGGGGRNAPGANPGSAVTISAVDAKDVQKYRAAKAKADELKVPLRISA